MDIDQFLSDFSNIIPFQIKIEVGKNDSHNGGCEKHHNNFRGKVYTCQRNINGIWQNVDIDASLVSMPIKIKVTCQEAKQITFQTLENKVTTSGVYKSYTNAKESSFQIYLRDQSQKQVGYADILLNAAGDIVSKYCSYQSKDQMHRIEQSIRFQFDEKKSGHIRRLETTLLEKTDIDTMERIRLKIYREQSQLVGIKMFVIPLFQEHASLELKEDTQNIKFFVKRCQYSSEKEAMMSKCYVDMNIQDTLLNYRKQKHFVEDIVRNHHGFPSWLRQDVIDYVENEDNDYLKGFIGEYVGHTYIQTNQASTFYVHTISNGLKYYTAVDIPRVTPTEEKVFLYGKEEKLLMSCLKNSTKFPTFVTKEESGKEELVDFPGCSSKSQELQEDFARFQQLAINISQQLESFKVNKLLEKK